jgi:chaperonin GroES
MGSRVRSPSGPIRGQEGTSFQDGSQASLGCLENHLSEPKKEFDMKFKPLYDRLLVKRIEANQKTASGLIIPDSAKEKPHEGEVIAVGQGRRMEDGTLRALVIQAGDRILFGKYSGEEIKIDGVEHVIVREDDVLAVFEA